ncbi:MAG TPA: class I SAM-dependent methyltransferase [Candidatus Dormibacteraeota bacterium]
MREIASSGGRGAVPMGGGSSSGTPLSRHWDAAYEGHGVAGVSWFQVAPTQSLAYVDRLQVPTDGPVVDIGGGAASLVDHLLERGFVDVSVLDVSRAALDAARQRVGAGAPVSWLHEDLLIWRPERRYVLWHDRAVLHFLVKPEDRDRYLAALRSALVPGGAVIIATFAPDGPDHCSGLPVARYSEHDLAALLGNGFRIVDACCDEHTTPAGVHQPFTWIAARAVD